MSEDGAGGGVDPVGSLIPIFLHPWSNSMDWNLNKSYIDDAMATTNAYLIYKLPYYVQLTGTYKIKCIMERFIGGPTDFHYTMKVGVSPSVDNILDEATVTSATSGSEFYPESSAFNLTAGQQILMEFYKTTNDGSGSYRIYRIALEVQSV